VLLLLLFRRGPVVGTRVALEADARFLVLGRRRAVTRRTRTTTVAAATIPATSTAVAATAAAPTTVPTTATTPVVAATTIPTAAAAATTKAPTASERRVHRAKAAAIPGTTAAAAAAAAPEAATATAGAATATAIRAEADRARGGGAATRGVRCAHFGDVLWSKTTLQQFKQIATQQTKVRIWAFTRSGGLKITRTPIPMIVPREWFFVCMFKVFETIQHLLHTPQPMFSSVCSFLQSFEVCFRF
jgi:hypothetical protein